MPELVCFSVISVKQFTKLDRTFEK